jgi:hypothetical protein
MKIKMYPIAPKVYEVDVKCDFTGFFVHTDEVMGTLDLKDEDGSAYARFPLISTTGGITLSGVGRNIFELRTASELKEHPWLELLLTQLMPV